MGFKHLVILDIMLRKIQRAVAKECLAMETVDSQEHILSAFSNYCIALKKDGKSVPLWTEGGALKGVYREIQKLRGEYRSNLAGVSHPELKQ